jgi:hypothetical protein
MSSDWWKRLDVEFVWGLRSCAETRCSNHASGLGIVAPTDHRRCRWATPMCVLSTSLPIARMSSSHSASRDSQLNNDRNAAGSLRGDSLLTEAFLETGVPSGANVVLALEIVMGIGLWVV